MIYLANMYLERYKVMLIDCRQYYLEPDLNHNLYSKAKVYVCGFITFCKIKYLEIYDQKNS